MHPTAFSRALPSQLGFDLGNAGMAISRIEDWIIACQYSSENISYMLRHTVQSQSYHSRINYPAQNTTQTRPAR